MMSAEKFCAGVVLSLLAIGTVSAQCPDGSPPPCDARRAVPLTATPKRVNPAMDDKTWIVLPFNNVTRAPDVDWLSDASVNMLSMDLSRWQDVHVIDDRRVADFMRELSRPANAKLSFNDGVTVAKRAGAGRLVIGDVLKVGSKTTVSATLYNARDGKEIRSARAETAIADSIMPMFGKLASTLLAVPGDAQLGSVGTTRVDAYHEYASGVQALNRFDAQAAKAHFDAAIKLDTTFALAHYKWAIASTYDNQASAARTSQVKLADVGNLLKAVEDTARIRHAKVAARLSADLPPREKKLVVGIAAMADHDNVRACDAYGSLVRADSSDVEALYGYGMCLLTDDRVIAAAGDTTKLAFRTSWNDAIKQFRRALAVDPTFHLAFDPVVQILTSPVRSGCRDANTTLTCADTVRQARYIARVRRSGDSITTIPTALGPDAGMIDQFIYSQRLSPLRDNVEAARVAAADWAASGPTEGLAHKHLAKLLIRLGRPAEAEGELKEAMVDPVIRIDKEILMLRIDIALKLRRGKEVNRLIDSLQVVFPGELGTTAFASFSVVLGQVGHLDSVYRSVLKGQDTTPQGKIVLQAQRIGLGFPSPWLAATEKEIFAKKNDCDFNCLGLMGLPYMFAVRVPREWPKFKADVSTERRMGPALALAAGDTAALRVAAVRLDSVSKAWAVSGNAEDGTTITAADAFLALGDSAAALRAVRRMMDTTLLASESTGLIGLGSVTFARATLWPRLILLRADLESSLASGDKSLARDLYSSFADLWARSDSEFAPVMTRVRGRLKALGG